MQNSALAERAVAHIVEDIEVIQERVTTGSDGSIVEILERSSGEHARVTRLGHVCAVYGYAMADSKDDSWEMGKVD